MFAQNIKKAEDIKRIRKIADFSQEKLAQLLGVSWITVSRWERETAKPSPEKIAELIRLAELISRIGRAIPKGKILAFLTAPHPLLRGYRPVELLKNDYSFEVLLDFIESAKSGDMA